MLNWEKLSQIDKNKVYGRSEHSWINCYVVLARLQVYGETSVGSNTKVYKTMVFAYIVWPAM